MLLTSNGWDLRNIAEIDQGTANCELFIFFQKTVVTIRTKIWTAILQFMGTYVCNDINIVRRGFKKQPNFTKEQPFVNFFKFVKNSRHDSNKFFTVVLNHIEILSKTP